MAFINLSEYRPLLDVSGNRSLSSQGDYIYSYRVNLPEKYSIGENTHDEIHGHWLDALRDFPPGTIVLKQDISRKKIVDVSKFSEDNFLQRATKKYYEGRKYYDHECLIHFVDAKRISVMRNTNVGNPFKKLPNVKEFIKNAKTDKEFESIVESKIQALNAKKVLRFTKLDPEEIEEHTRLYFNGLLSDRITDTVRDSNGYKIGNRYVGAFAIRRNQQIKQDISNCVIDRSMSGVKSKYYKGFAEGLSFELGCDHIYNQVFFIENSDRIRVELEKRQEQFQGARNFGRVNKVTAKILGDELERLSEDDNHLLIRGHFNIIFFADTEEEFLKHDIKISSVFDEMKVLPYAPKENNLANIINNSFMGTVSLLDADNSFIMDMQLALCFFSNVTNYKDDQEGLLFNDRVFDRPVVRQVWHSNKKYVTAPHFAISAPTGEGKSFLSNHILRQFIEQGMLGVINDCGDSYEKLTHLYPGKGVYIRFREGESLGVNPFALYGEEELTTDKINQLVNFIVIHSKRGEVPSEEEKVSLRKIIKSFYESVDTEHSFPAFYGFVEYNGEEIYDTLEIEPDYFNLNQFIHNCGEFVGEGAYAYLYKSTVNRTFNPAETQFIVFEFANALNDPLLLSVLTQLSAAATEQLIWADRSRRGFVFYDEFAKLLKNDVVWSAVEYSAQTLRKYDSAIGIVLQSPAQLPENNEAESIITNLQTFYCITDKKGYEHHQKRFKFHEHDVYQMESLNSNFEIERPYSEIYMKRGEHGNVIRLGTPVEVKLAYETEGKHYTKMLEIYQELGDMEKVIDQYKNMI